ncbi:MAG: hypothetical protein EOP84_35590 [Verrucomicrobiaceae bacterium]|nr:MAG: hypothetical protein EOP84_35590 [Verrucomicrobiaceae bacterium]
MPMYFFDVLEVDGTVERDVVGIELPGDQQALEAASRTVMSVLIEEAPQHPEFMVQVVVRDAAGNEIGRRDAALIQSDKRD